MEENRIISDKLSELYRERREGFVAFALSYTRNRDAAEDLFMDAMTALWQRRDTIAADANLPALMLTVVKNKCIDYLIRLKKRNEIDHTLTELQQRELNLRIETLNDTNPDNIFSQEIQSIVHETLEKMSPQTRRIYQMSRHEHLSNREIAEETGLSIKSVEHHITKCLKALRIALHDYVGMWLLL